MDGNYRKFYDKKFINKKMNGVMNDQILKDKSKSNIHRILQDKYYSNINS